MYTIDEAKTKMQKYVDYQNNIYYINNDSHPNIVIYDELTQTKDFGWIFFWQVAEVKGDYSNVIIGNGPVIIEKDTLDMYSMKTALKIEDNIKLYAEDKNNLGKLEEDEDGNFDIVNLED
jgi:roadblock/LC7 domain-containing protein